MRRIRISDEYEALIDSEDAELVSGFVWHPLTTDSGIVYAHASRRSMHFYMHRLVAGAGAEELIDHANRNGLDNRKANLRVATASQNLANAPKQLRKVGGSTSKYKGVCWDKARGKWAAYIAVGADRRRRALGRFSDEVTAARAYDAAALELWGEFARLNFEGAETCP